MQLWQSASLTEQRQSNFVYVSATAMQLMIVQKSKCNAFCRFAKTRALKLANSQKVSKTNQPVHKCNGKEVSNLQEHSWHNPATCWCNCNDPCKLQECPHAVLVMSCNHQESCWIRSRKAVVNLWRQRWWSQQSATGNLTDSHNFWLQSQS